MPDYKRKRVKKTFLNRKKHIATNSDIIMEPQKKNAQRGIVPEKDIKVVRGAKYNRKRKSRFFISTAAVIALLYFVFTLILPVSVYENIVNVTALMGHGRYPIDVSGGTVISSYSNGSHYYVLTDTSITAYSNSGKTVLNDMHGFSNPIMSVSQTRVMVYDQGGNTVHIYNLGGKLHTLETKKEIITASISRSGAFAVATHSDSYTSVVNVYNKNFEQIFIWNSAKDIINNVLLNPSGNRLAVSTLNAVAGQYNSKMLILGFESADPLHTTELENSIVLALNNTGKGVSIVTSNKYKFVHWSKFNSNEVTASGEINMVRKSSKGLLVVFNRANDRGDNNIVLISNKGIKTKEFKINNIITDIQYTKGRVYYVSDTLVNIVDGSGNILRHGNCGYGTQKIVVISSHSIANITDTEIVKTDIDKGVS